MIIYYSCPAGQIENRLLRPADSFQTVRISLGSGCCLRYLRSEEPRFGISHLRGILLTTCLTNKQTKPSLFALQDDVFNTNVSFLSAKRFTVHYYINLIIITINNLLVPHVSTYIDCLQVAVIDVHKFLVVYFTYITHFAIDVMCGLDCDLF